MNEQSCCKHSTYSVAYERGDFFETTVLYSYCVKRKLKRQYANINILAQLSLLDAQYSTRGYPVIVNNIASSLVLNDAY